MTTRQSRRDRRSIARPAVVLGVGLGGFLDGIVLHQLLQWHHLVSSREPTDTVAGLETNTLWDGVFHAAMWLVVTVGVWLVWRAARAGGRTDWRALVGWALVGWGGFNIFDGVVDHWLLGLHHIREGVDNELAYDVAFVLLGVALCAGGWLLQRSPRSRTRRT